jgi:hypothetical protein
LRNIIQQVICCGTGKIPGCKYFSAVRANRREKKSVAPRTGIFLGKPEPSALRIHSGQN